MKSQRQKRRYKSQGKNTVCEKEDCASGDTSELFSFEAELDRSVYKIMYTVLK